MKMKRRFASILAFIFLFVIGLNQPYSIKAAEANQWIELSRMDNVAANKTFSIRFNRSMNANEVDAIVIEKNNKFIAAEISYEGDKINITPVSAFGEGEYSLKILLNNGAKYLMKFTASNTEYHYANYTSNKVIKVYPRSDSGFSYPYYLSIPKGIDVAKDVHILVEPNNFGKVGSAVEQDRDVFKSLINESNMSNRINRLLNSVILMPVFPRGVTADGKEDWRLYTHELDRDTILGLDNEKIRIDDQLANMITNAKTVLSSKERINTKDKVFMIGFSASARFTNRFALLHPELVQAVATGGINANPMLPLEELDGQKLIYPVGIGDAKAILGRSIDLEAYKNVKQYIYMGETDTNDDVAFQDGYDEPERQQIYNLIGYKQMPDRWNKTQEIFKSLPYPIQFVTYKGIGHQMNNDTDRDVLEFFEQNSGDKFVNIQPHNAY
jgi:hypothetical protein